MATNAIFEQWKTYRQQVMPVGASAIQVTETKRAFFAGARALMTLMMINVSDGPEITDGDMDFMAGIQGELDGYLARMKRGLE